MVGVVGRMSGGKTYYAVEMMVGALRSGHVVVTNVELDCKGVSDFLGVPCVQWKRLYFKLVDGVPNGYHQISQGDYDSYPTGSPRGSADYNRDLVYIVLDEVSSIFDSMVHAADSNVQKVATWARHSHKRGQEIVLIMQFASELHKRLRVHINEYISCTNSATIRIPVVGWHLPPFLRHFSVRTRYLDDGTTQIEDAKWIPFDPRIFKCYNTAQIVVGRNVSLQPIRVDMDDSFKKFRDVSFAFSKLLVFSVLILIVAGVLLWVLMIIAYGD